jgi:hypothetical protein
LATCCEIVTKKFAARVKVNNICRPDDPHARMLPGPGAPGDDAIFQYVKGIFLYFILASGHICPHAMRWLQNKFAMTIRVKNIFRPHDPDA